MATNNLASNIAQTINDFADIKTAITEKGVNVPDGTPTADYDDLVRQIQSGGDDCDAIIQAAWLTVSVTGNGGDLAYECSPFTRTLTSPEGIWDIHFGLTGVHCDFENLTDGTIMFDECTSITDVVTNLPNLVNGNRMFSTCAGMTSFKAGNGQYGYSMPKLKNGRYMFSHCALESFDTNMPVLETGNYMFTNCGYLHTFSPDISGLKNGTGMFEGCMNLTNFTSSLASLENGASMFSGCDQLTVESLVNILTTLPDRTGSEQATLTIGSINMAKLTAGQIATGTNKNWNII